jgi:hypothetical protein
LCEYTALVLSSPALSKKGVCKPLFAALGENPDLEYLIIDSDIVRTHQRTADAKWKVKMRRSGVPAAA